MELSQSVESLLVLPHLQEHTIDERSPLFNLTHDDLVARNAEIVITYEGVSDFGDNFMVRTSYLASEIQWGCQFVPITYKAPPGMTHHSVDLSRFHDVVRQADLPPLPKGELSRLILAGGVTLAPQTLPYPALGENTLVLSDLCVISMRDGERMLMFRVGDSRPGQMLEVHVRAYLHEWAPRVTKEGEQIPLNVQVCLLAILVHVSACTRPDHALDCALFA
jgi:hypothetical protein